MVQTRFSLILYFRMVVRFFYFFSSPEPKVNRLAYSIGRHPSSLVWPCVRPPIRSYVRQHFQATSPLKRQGSLLPNILYSIYRQGGGGLGGGSGINHTVLELWLFWHGLYAKN